MNDIKLNNSHIFYLIVINYLVLNNLKFIKIFHYIYYSVNMRKNTNNGKQEF
jgi:hypothetical protein